MTHGLDTDYLFIHRVQELAAQARLSFFLIEPLWVRAFYEGMQQGTVWSRVLLNLHSEHHEPEEVYHRLVRLAVSHHTRVVDHPDVALAAFDKARMHPRLIWWGIHVPYTVFVPHDQAATFRLSDEHRQALGTPFVIKPSMGYGRRGVVLDAVEERDLRRSMEAWPKGQYLLQRRIVPRSIGGEPAYFRLFYVFGSVWCCWWNCHTHRYRLATSEESEAMSRPTLEQIAHRIAALTGMQFFSTEVALPEKGEPVVIDYVNDQCHLLSQSSNPEIGVPDPVILAIAKRLVEAAVNLLRS